MKCESSMDIRKYKVEDHNEVVGLLRRVFPDDPPHNEPSRVIEAKLAIDDLIFVAVDKGIIIGVAMAGYDGHRGWLYSVAVDPNNRRLGIGHGLVEHAIKVLKNIGCIKVNLQVRSSNSEVVAFYKALGFETEERISMGKLLI
jgi:ribosomal protein S18 acetylase RimI-like enzyme